MSLPVVGNMGCSIVQKSEQRAFDGAHGNQLMFFAMIFACIVCCILYSRDKCEDVKVVMKSSYYPIAAGICNVGLNFCVILMATGPLSPSLIYPAIAVGGLSLTALFSVFAFKEKLSWQRWLGISIGALATVLLSIS